MQNDLREILRRLESLKAKTQSLGEDRERLQETIDQAETSLKEARRLLEAAEKKSGKSKPK